MINSEESDSGRIGNYWRTDCTNENMFFLIALAFVIDIRKASPDFSLCICFRNGHVEHTQATTAGHNSKEMQIPRDFFSHPLSYSNGEKILNPGSFIFSLVVVLVTMVLAGLEIWTSALSAMMVV